VLKKVGKLIIRDFLKSSPLWMSEAIAMPILGFALVFISSAFGQSVEYPVSPGDTLYIYVWGEDTLSGAVTVGVDGTIVLPPPVGSLYVNRLTASEITDLLTKRLKEFVKQPVVTVSIREFQGFMVHILGQVRSPSFYRVPEGTSIQELITEAGGFTELADPSSIILIRKDDERVEKKIDFSRFLKQNDMESNPVLIHSNHILMPLPML